MKILFVFLDDYPYSGACTNIIKNLIFQGKLEDALEQIDILTAKHRFFEPSIEIIDGITVFRRIICDKYSSSEILKSFWQNPIINLYIFIIKILHKLYKNFVNRYSDRFYHKPLLKALINLKAQNYDYIIPIGGDFNIVEAVKNFSMIYMTPMIIYQVDPCSENMAESESTECERKSIERECFRVAKYIITTPILFKHVKMVLKGLNRNIADCIQMEFPNVTPDINNIFNQKIPVICVFSGSIYRGIRDPSYTIRLFSSLITEGLVDLVFVGPSKNDVPVEYHYLPIIYYSDQSIVSAKESIIQSSFLINIGNKMRNQVPSKLFDYISTGKPIINICKNRDCPSIKYLAQYPLAINLFEEDYLLTKQLEDLKVFISRNIGKTVDPNEISKFYYKCTPKYCADQFVKILGLLEQR